MLLKDATTVDEPGFGPINLTDVDGVLYFVTLTGLWRSDGTTAGTGELVPSVYPGTFEERYVTRLGSHVLFAGDDPAAGTELLMLPDAAGCGNGVVGGGEDCDDANFDDGDACTTACKAAACGDGLLQVGVEDCDDGNTVGGDCCSSTCTFEASGSPCADDGSVCSTDQCDGAGACVHPPANAGAPCRGAAGDCDLAESCDGVHPLCPLDAFESTAVTCRPPAGACDAAEECSGTAAVCPFDQMLFGCGTTTTSTTISTSSTTSTTLPPLSACAALPQVGCKQPTVPAVGAVLLKADPAKPIANKVQWKWNKGAATTFAELGDPRPVGGTEYVFCAYAGPAEGLVFQARIPAGLPCSSGHPCWSIKGSSSYDFKSKSTNPDGVTALHVAAGDSGKATAKLAGKGTDLSFRPFGLPALPLATPLRVQLQGDNGTCFEGTFSTAIKNDGIQFKAKSD